MSTQKRTLRRTKRNRRGKRRTGGSWWNPFAKKTIDEQIAELEQKLAALKAKKEEQTMAPAPPAQENDGAAAAAATEATSQI
jgi:cytochrome c553